MDYNKILKYIYPLIVIIIGVALSYMSTLSMNVIYRAIFQVGVVILLIIIGRMIYKKS